MWALTGLVLLAAAARSRAQQVLDAASFGHRDGRVSPNLHAIPAWHLSGEPKIHTDRVILTPPYPGAKAAAAWTDGRITQTEWEAELSFRATGQDHAGGSLQVWYTRENEKQLATNSIYTVGKFEGLAVVVDPHGGSHGGGGVRAFLNDGTTDYKGHQHLEGLAFGHCDYVYRNLGRPSLLKIRQDALGFEVFVDGRSCIRSNDVILPANNFFGITANSAEAPDSFEVFKFITTTLPPGAWPATPPPPAYDARGASPPPPSSGGGNAAGVASDAKLDEILRAAQGARDVVARLQEDARQQDSEARRRADELRAGVATLQQKVAALDAAVAGLRKDFGEKDYGAHFDDLRAGLNARHEAMLEYLPEKMHTLISSRAPNLGFFVFLILLFQVVLAVAYIVYKRRRANAPKKYL